MLHGHAGGIGAGMDLRSMLSRARGLRALGRSLYSDPTNSDPVGSE